MPLIKIELAEGKDKKFLSDVMISVMQSVAEILQLPKDDRNIRLIEYKAELFEMKHPYEMLIEITMFAGRSSETKGKLFQAIVKNLYSKLLIEIEKVYIIINEQPLENWGLRGGIQASEINFDFKIKL